MKEKDRLNIQDHTWAESWDTDSVTKVACSDVDAFHGLTDEPNQLLIHNGIIPREKGNLKMERING